MSDNQKWQPAIDNFGRMIGNDTYERDYPLSLAYALEEAYKKDNAGFDSLEAFAANKIGNMIANSLIRKGKAYNMFANNPKTSAAYENYNSSVEYMLWNIHSAIMAHSGIDDEYFDEFAEFIDGHKVEVILKHPELVDNEDENYYFKP